MCYISPILDNMPLFEFLLSLNSSSLYSTDVLVCITLSLLDIVILTFIVLHVRLWSFIVT